MSILSATLLLLTSVAACFIYRSFDNDSKDDTYETYLNKLHGLLKSIEFNGTHNLLHFNILAHFIKDEIIIHGDVNDSTYSKGILKLTWKKYKESLSYKTLKETYGILRIKKEFLRQVYSIPVNNHYQDLHHRSKVSKELYDFFSSLDIILTKGRLRVPISVRLYTYTPDTLACLVNFVRGTSKIGKGDLNTPIDLIILEWVGSKISDKNVRRTQIVPRMYWITNVVPGNKSTDLTICQTNISFTIMDNPSHLLRVSDAIFWEYQKWNNHENRCIEYFKIECGESPHQILRYDSKEWIDLSSKKDCSYDNYSLDINSFLDQ